jgi:hypothetical protein
MEKAPINQTLSPENRHKIEKFVTRTYLFVMSIIDFVLLMKNIKIAPHFLLWVMLALHISIPIFLYKKRKLKWSKAAITSLTLTLLCMSLVVSAGSYHKSKKHIKTENYTVASAPAMQPAVSNNTIDNLHYETPYTLNSDNGRTHVYVLLKPIAPSEKKFQADIKAIINILVSQCESKTSIEFYDDRDLLDVAYHYKTRNEPTPLRYNSRFTRHLVAMFDGELSNFTYPNSISFFPAANTKDSPRLAPYISTIEYNPIVDSSMSSKETNSNEEFSQDGIVETNAKRESTTETIEGNSATQEHHENSYETASLPQEKVDKMVRDLKKAGIVMSLKPEVNTVYINPDAWAMMKLQDKQNLHLFLSSYCFYHCAVDALIVHIKDGYSDKLLGETEFWDHGLSVKN